MKSFRKQNIHLQGFGSQTLGGFKPSENEIKLFNVKNNETVVRKTNRKFLLSVLNSVTGPLSKYRYHFKLNYLIIELVFLKKAAQW